MDNFINFYTQEIPYIDESNKKVYNVAVYTYIHKSYYMADRP